MIKVFIGYDAKETIAYHVLAHSIIRRASEPVEIIPLKRELLKASFHRPRGEYDSTDFSNSRWIIPYLCGYEGHAIFMDCDMLCLSDIKHLWMQKPNQHAVAVKMHNYEPTAETKFLGQMQTKYKRKNWSSLMIFNNEKCRALSKHIVNTMSPGLWFHQFAWLPDNDICEINGHWNLLVGHDEPVDDPKLVHYTQYTPWFHDNDHHIDYREEWLSELEHMLCGDNPYAKDGMQLFVKSLLEQGRKNA